ncbi:MAG TPA: aminotransferase class IV [Salinivirgaceae bacterium]|nr:aminotransferase class IV [Salinivirgaceae bacterium]
MQKTRGEWVVLNKLLVESIDISHTKLPIGKTAYEVIKVIEGKPLFVSQHFKRLQESTQKSGIALNLTEIEVLNSIKALVNSNNISIGNIEISISKNHILVRFIPHSYPTPEMYKVGVHVGFYYAERNNPTVKIKNNRLRNNINKIIKEKGYFEVLLVSKQGYITEGSRSNIMFIDNNNKVYTAPDSHVLKGVTRQTVMDICKKLNIEVITKPITKQMLNDFSAAFLTGTSPGVIPIKSIGYKSLSIENQTLQSIVNEFQCAISNEQLAISNEQ